MGQEGDIYGRADDFKRMFRETDNRNGCAKRGCEKSLFCGFADNGFIRYSVIFQQAAATFFTAPFLYGRSLFIKSLLIHHIHRRPIQPASDILCSTVHDPLSAFP